MSDNLGNFLVDLASDSYRLSDFLADPNAMLDRSTLTAEEKTAVLAGDGAGIRTALGLAPGEAAASVLGKKKGPRSKPKPKPRPKPKSKTSRKKR